MWNQIDSMNKVVFDWLSDIFGNKSSDYIIPVNPPPFCGILPRKSLISRMDWVSCVRDNNLPHLPFPPPNKKSSTIKS